MDVIGFGVLVDRTQSAVSLLLHSAINKPSGKKLQQKKMRKRIKPMRAVHYFVGAGIWQSINSSMGKTKKTVKSLKAKNQNKTEMAHALKVSVKCNKKLALV